jgi:hypothetical protein
LKIDRWLVTCAFIHMTQNYLLDRRLGSDREEPIGVLWN